MIYIRIFITILLTLNLAGYADAEYRKKTHTLNDIRNGQTYQVRVRTGNMAVDRKVYNTARDILSDYLPITEESNTGFIEVLFSSTLGQGILGSKPAYSTNVAYGDNWFTDSTNAEFSSPIEVESNEGGIVRWQKSHMSVTIKDLKDNTLWSAEYTYKGIQDIAGLMNKINEGANLCLDRIVSKFKSDFNIDKKPSKTRKVKMPAIGLIVKSRWRNAGKNSLGHSIKVDSHSITYPSQDVIRLWTQSDLHDNHFIDFVDFIEINCKNKTFRYLEGRLDKNPSLYPHSAEPVMIAPESTPERVLRLLCTE